MSLKKAGSVSFHFSQKKSGDSIQNWFVWRFGSRLWRRQKLNNRRRVVLRLRRSFHYRSALPCDNAIPSAQTILCRTLKNTFLLAFASLFADISTEMLYPILPVFLTQTLKASGSIVGLVEGLAQATQNIVQGFSGALSDKLQKRKAIALSGYFLAAIAKPLMGISTVWQGVFSRAASGPVRRRQPLGAA